MNTVDALSYGVVIWKPTVAVTREWNVSCYFANLDIWIDENDQKKERFFT